MQATIVAYYEEKPQPLLELIGSCQEKLAYRLAKAFRPYGIEQVHATIVGLEGEIEGDQIVNENFRKLRGQARPMQLDELLTFLKSTNLLPIDVGVGRYSRRRQYPFTSKDQHPYFRSFSAQGDIAVVMGWPRSGHHYPTSLYEFRRELERFNILHKYHKTEKSVDNDFFFVIGRIARKEVDVGVISEIEEEVRSFMATKVPVSLTITQDNISIVGYIDPQLPLDTSLRFPIVSDDLTSSRLHDLYLANGPAAYSVSPDSPGQ